MSESLYSILLLGIKTLPSHQIVIITFLGNSYAVLARKYVQWLLSSRGNGLVKIVTGMRRVGKSFLLFMLFRKRLIDSGFPAWRASQDSLIRG